MELEAQVFEVERAKARRSWRENALKAKLSEVEERDRRDDIEGGRARAVSGVEAMEGEGVLG